MFVGGLTVILVGPPVLAQTGDSLNDRLLFERVFEDSGLKDRGLASDAKFNMQYQRPAPYDPDVAADYVDGRIAKQTKARRVLTRTLRQNSKVGPAMIRGGLATVGLGIWIHNGIALYCGSTEIGSETGANCTEPLVLDPQFRRASDVEGDTVFRTYSNGNLDGAGMVTSFKYDYSTSTGDCKVTIAYEMQRYSSYPSGDTGQIGFGRVAGATDYGSTGAGCGFAKGVYKPDYYGPEPNPYVLGPRSEDMRAPDVRLQFFTGDRGGGRSSLAPFGPVISVGQPMSWDNPVFDVGTVDTQATPAEYTPSPGDYLMSPEETTAWADRIRGDPDYDPTFDNPRTEEERERKYGPLARRWTNPDGSETMEYQDGTRVTRYPDGTTRTDAPPGVETGTPTYPAPQVWEGPQVAGDPTVNPAPDQYEEPLAEPPPTEEPPTEDPPTEPPVEPPPTSEPPPPAGASCPTARKSQFDLPEFNMQDKFPFALISWMGTSVATLASAPSSSAPCLDLFGGQRWCFTEMQGIVSLIRNVLWFLIGGIFMPIGFYVLIKGSGGVE